MNTTLIPLTRHQWWLILSFALLLFTVVLDFMLLPALSATLLSDLTLSTQQFGIVASAYAFSAGLSALLITAYADRVGRRRLLLWYYVGFLIGLMACALASSYYGLLLARVCTGVFGGVIASICYAAISDLFTGQQRGRVLGYVQVAFALAQVLGLPLVLYLATNYYWQLAYWLIVVVGVIAFSLAYWVVQLDNKPDKRSTAPWEPLQENLRPLTYRLLFITNICLVGGDVLFTTFSASFCTYNLGVAEEQLAWIYGSIGITTLLISPLVGHLVDSWGRAPVFAGGTILAVSMLLVFTHLESAALSLVIFLHVLIFIGTNARMISAGALSMRVSAVENRGAFLAIDAALQQLAAGGAAVLAGWIIFRTTEGSLLFFPRVGWVAVALMILSLVLVYTVEKKLKHR